MIVVISGSIRNGNNSIKVARHLEHLYREHGEETRLLDLQELPSEVFTGDVYRNRPDAVTADFVDPLLAADGLVVVVPEYNGSYSGALKHFIDLLPFPESFEGRPVAFVGVAAGAYGGLRAVEQLQMVFAYRNGVLFNKRVFIANAYSVFDESGALVEEGICERLAAQTVGFSQFVKQLRQTD